MASKHGQFLLLAAAAHILFATSAIVAVDDITTSSPIENQCLPEGRELSAILQHQRSKLNWWKRLKEFGYDSYTPPNYPNATDVSIAMWPFGLSRVDEVTQTIKVNTYVEMEWTDERLAFNLDMMTNHYCYPYRGKFTLQAGDNEQEQLDSKIWQPRLLLEARQDGFTTPFLKIIDFTVRADGEVRLKAFFQEARLCNIQTKRYPFDKQVCTIELTASQNVTLRHVNHLSGVSREELIKTRKDDQKNYETNEWILFDIEEQSFASPTQSTYGNENNSDSSIESRIRFRRKYTRHVINWIVSPILLSISSVIGMYRGCEIGERFSFGGTIVVTITLMVNELRSVLGVSEDYPILGRMYLGLEITLILATLLSGWPRRFGNSVKARKPKQRFQKLFVVQNLVVPFTSSQVGNGPSAALQDKFTNYCFAARVVQNWTDDEFDWAVLSFILMLQIGVVTYCVVEWLI